MLTSPESAINCRAPAWRHLRHSLLRQCRIAADDLRNIPRYVLRALIGVALVCGLLSLWGLRGDGRLPDMTPLSGLDPYCISSAQFIFDETTVEARWNGLAPRWPYSIG